MKFGAITLAQSTAVAMLAAFSLLCFWIAKPIVDNQYLLTKNKTEPAVIDFVRFYQTGAMCLSSDKSRIYDADYQTEFTNKLISPNHISKMLIYYVPFMFPLMAPLATQSMTTAYSIFFFVTLAFGLFSLLLLNRLLKRFSAVDCLIFLLAVFASGSSIFDLRIGQIAWLMLGLFCYFYYFLERRLDHFAGIALAFLSMKFQYLPLVVIGLIADRRYKVLVWAVIGEACLLCLSGMTIGWSNVIGYPLTLFQQKMTSPVSEPYLTDMVSLSGPLFMFMGKKEAFMLNNIAILPVAFLVYRLWRISTAGRVSRHWAMALTMVGVLLISPHCFAYDLLFLALPALLTLPSLNPKTLLSLPDKALTIWSLTLVIYPLATWVAFITIQFWICFVLNLILLASGLRCALRAKPEEPPTASSETAGAQ